MLLQQKNVKAGVVLGIILDKTQFDIKLIIEPYLNGREQGFAVQAPSGKKVVFSEDRRSDGIVVYVGVSTDFSMQGNSPSDEVYYLRRVFECDEYLEAANYALEQL